MSEKLSATWALANIEDHSVVPVLTDILKTSVNTFIRVYSMCGIAKNYVEEQHGKEAVLEIMAINHKSDHKTDGYSYSLWALGKIGALEAFEMALQILPNLLVAEHITYLIGGMSFSSITHPNVGAAILPYLDHEDMFVREIVAEALGRLKIVNAVNKLIENLDDSEDQVTDAIIDALGELGDKSAVPHLITRLNSFPLSTLSALTKLEDPSALSAIKAYTPHGTFFDELNTIHRNAIERLSRLS